MSVRNFSSDRLRAPTQRITWQWVGIPILSLLCCSCSTLPPSRGTVPQQTPKEQAASEPRVTPMPPPAVSTESSRKMLLSADLAFSRACEERGAPEAFYEFVASDGVCLLTGEPPIQGRDAIKVRFAASPAESISWKPRESEICSTSDLGYTWGTYQARTSAPDNPVSTSGKYVIVWKKQSDGAWRAAVFTTSAGSAAARNQE